MLALLAACTPCRSTGTWPRRCCATSRYTRGWVFHSFMSALGLGQKMPPLAFRSLASSSIDGFLAGRCRHVQTLVSQWAYLGLRPLTMSKKRRLDLLGDRAARAGADLDAVEFADGRDFGGGAGEEGLVGDVDLVARDALLHDLDAEVLADVEHGVAGDAVQRAGRQVGRVDHAVLDDEDVLARAFGDEARGCPAAAPRRSRRPALPCWPGSSCCSCSPPWPASS